MSRRDKPPPERRRVEHQPRASRGARGGQNSSPPRLIVIGLATVLILGSLGFGIFTVLLRGEDAADPSSTGAASQPPASPTATANVPVVEPLVLAISVDGLNPDAIQRLGASGAPNFHRLIAEGASTLNARTAYELTTTLPNHTGMLTGRGVFGAAGHGVTFNDDNNGTVAATHGTYVPSMFDVAHDHGLTTALLVEKDKFNFLMRSWGAQNGAADQTGRNDGRNKIDIEIVGEDAEVMARARAVLGNQEADLIFLHLKAPDQAGHANGWLSPAYVEAVRSVDRDLGQILETIEATPAVKERITILLTADHGGPTGRGSHDDMTVLANYRIPFIAWGHGVGSGTDLYAANGGRVDPGTTRPTYEGAQPIRNLDIADVALRALGLEPIVEALSSSWPSVSLN